jgi:hypothetical protein
LHKNKKYYFFQAEEEALDIAEAEVKFREAYR